MGFLKITTSLVVETKSPPFLMVEMFGSLQSNAIESRLLLKLKVKLSRIP